MKSVRIMVMLAAAAAAFGKIEFGWYSNNNIHYIESFSRDNFDLIIKYKNVVPPETDSQMIQYLDSSYSIDPKIRYFVQINPFLLDRIQKLKNASPPGDISDRLDSIRTFVRLAERPNTAGWYLADEPSDPRLHHGEFIKISTLIELYDLIKAESALPVAITETGNGWNHRETAGPEELTYADACDIGMSDWYPFNEDTEELPLETRRIAKAIECLKTAFQKSGRPLLFYSVVQGYGRLDWTDRLVPFKKRNPSIMEIRYQTYTSLIHGAKGIIHWAWYRSNPTVVRRVRNERNRMNVHRILEIFDTPQINHFITSSDTIDSDRNGVRDINFSFHHYDRDSIRQNYYLFAANDSPKVRPVTFTAGFPIPTVQVVGEGRSIPVSENRFTDTFRKYQIHIYKFERDTIPDEH